MKTNTNNKRYAKSENGEPLDQDNLLATALNHQNINH